MNSITSFFNSEISLFGYCINLSQIAGATAVITACAMQRIFRRPVPSDEMFWKKLEEVPTLEQTEGPIVIQGRKIFEDAKAAKLEVTFACTEQSKYVEQYILPSKQPKTVLDLGCGLGVNSIPLYSKNWRVFAVDRESKVLEAYQKTANDVAAYYRQNQISLGQLTVTCGDITTVEYPADCDVVLAIDVLAYVPPNKLRSTMRKIHNAICPGGTLVGTLFFQPKQDNSFRELMEKLGAHFYPNPDVTKEIVTRSGFQITQARLREDSDRIPPYCFEFIAQKASASCNNF